MVFCPYHCSTACLSYLPNLQPKSSAIVFYNVALDVTISRSINTNQSSRWSMLINHHDQQIVRRKTRNLELCFGPNVQTEQAIFEKSLIYQAIWLRFLCSLVSVIWFETNKINWRREERPIGLGAVKLLRDLLWSVGGLAQQAVVAKAHAKVRARMRNWSIWCQGLSSTIGCVMAH